MSEHQSIHLLLLTPGFPTDEQDTRCIPALQDFVLALQSMHPEWKITVLALQYPTRTTRYSWNGIEVIPCYGNNRSFPMRLLTWKKAYTLLQKIHKAHPIQMLHSFWLTEAAFLGQLFSRNNGIPHLTTLMGQDVLPQNPYTRWISPKSTQVVAVSDFQARLFEQKTNKWGLPTVIPFGLHSQVYPSDHRPIDVFGAGNFTTGKDFMTFVHTVHHLRQSFPQLRAELAGDGPERTALEAEANRLQLDHHLTFLGSISREEVLRKMGQSKVFLHPSNYESFGMVFTEALASGMVIVSREVGHALAGPRWKLSTSPQQFTALTTNFLNAPHPPLTTEGLTAQHTAQAYTDLYLRSTSKTKK